LSDREGFFIGSYFQLSALASRPKA